MRRMDGPCVRKDETVDSREEVLISMCLIQKRRNQEILLGEDFDSVRFVRFVITQMSYWYDTSSQTKHDRIVDTRHEITFGRDRGLPTKFVC